MSLLCGSPTVKLSPVWTRKPKSQRPPPSLTWAPLIEFRRQRELETRRKERRKELGRSLPKLVKRPAIVARPAPPLGSPGRQVLAGSASEPMLSNKSGSRVVLEPLDRDDHGAGDPLSPLPGIPPKSGSAQAAFDRPLSGSSQPDTVRRATEPHLMAVDRGDARKQTNHLAEKLLDANIKSKREEGIAVMSPKVHFASNPGSSQSRRDSPAFIADMIGYAFSRVQQSGVVTVGKQLCTAMAILGYQYPIHEYIDKIIDKNVRGRESLDQADFQTVCDAYEAELFQFLSKIMVADTCPRDSCLELLIEAGVPFMPGAAAEYERHLLRQTSPSDDDGFGADDDEEVDVKEFKTIYCNAKAKAGLTSDEYQRFATQFESLKDDDATVGIEAFKQALSWNETSVRLAGGPKVVGAIANSLAARSRRGRVTLDPRAFTREDASEDAGSPGSRPRSGGSRPSSRSRANTAPGDDRATLQGFMAGARAMHECIHKGLLAVLKSRGFETGAVVPATELLGIFEEAGFYSVMPHDVEAFLELCNLSDKETLEFDQIYAVLTAYSRSNGVTPEERKSIEELFHRFDDDGSGTLDVTEIGPLIRWLGYQPSKYRVYDFCEGFGLNESSEVDLEEFVQLVSKYTEYSLSQTRSYFYPVGHTSGVSKELSVREHLEELLRVAGYDPSPHEIKNLRRQCIHEKVNFQTFKQLEMSHRKHVIRTMQANGGLTDPELEKHKAYFEENDRNETGSISPEALRKLFAALFPEKLKDREFHIKIAQMIKEADVDGNQQFDFEEYVDLMQKVTAEVDRDVLVRGLKLGAELGFKREEVQQFRDLYRLCDDDMSGDISFKELVVLFGNLIRMDKKAEAELRVMFDEVDDGDEQMDFWEFLEFMKKVQTTNWRNINGES
eukprot:TRINITY_DN15641_c0_g1_i3.p1 TRINITY_DN15641_c0_g1~~TRINITY_DN15641_c0_g1_i3.p1  ORF type:complete len:897 (+),score=213.27 TRINITY_DN15641_c0_g1_i3:144-2834(+)